MKIATLLSITVVLCVGALIASKTLGHHTEQQPPLVSIPGMRGRDRQ